MTLVYVKHTCMEVGKVVFEGAINNVNGGISNAGHTSSDGLSRCCVVCEYAVGQVNTEVVIVVHIQHTAIGGRVVVEC